MASPSRNQTMPNRPGLDLGPSASMSTSKTVLAPDETLFGRSRTENRAVEASHEMGRQQPLTRVLSARGLRSWQAMDNLSAENTRLKAEMETAQIRHAEKVERMVTDLVNAHSELRAKNVTLSDQRGIIEKQNTELKQLQQEVGQFTTQTREQDLQMRVKDQHLREREFELRTTKDKLGQEQKERGKEVAELRELQKVVKSQESTQKTNDASQLKTVRSRADTLQQEVHDLKKTHASTLSQVETENARAINQHKFEHQQLQSQITAVETRMQQMTQEAKDKSQAQQQLEAAHANDLAEAHRTANFFKKNSEATTRVNKGLEAELQSLRQTLQGGGDVKEDGSAHGALQGDSFSDPPGTWPDMEMQRSSPSSQRKRLNMPNMF